MQQSSSTAQQALQSSQQVLPTGTTIQNQIPVTRYVTVIPGKSGENIDGLLFI